MTIEENLCADGLSQEDPRQDEPVPQPSPSGRESQWSREPKLTRRAGSGAERVDVVIVGARVAGTAAAVPLARAGRKVVLIDKSRFPSDRLSTHVLVPNGVAELRRMGALPEALELNPAIVRYLELVIGNVRVRERFTPVDGIDYGVCIPRLQQDMVLVNAARKAGAEVRERCSLEEILWRDGRAAGIRYRHGSDTHEIHAKLVIGADGRRSHVAAAVGSWTPYRGSRNGRGFAFAYLDDPRVGTPDHETYGIYRAGSSTCLTLPSCPTRPDAGRLDGSRRGHPPLPPGSGGCLGGEARRGSGPGPAHRRRHEQEQIALHHGPVGLLPRLERVGVGAGG
ncbi:NAD(P)/FAD-dependent oxidoreductase [Protofrankia symbiont of Coriaria ruscifolia]|uniref:NAD(P)/FAD-dependent oxidoreductase n=1 Tax=Protofrankia symbiont of Coriaria ruscifolia TaxID=1306542 RepID=UPI001A93FD28|nr:FAD-dependent monooxygenase [Protofrankia symbiont of Coriaria ruscifolia]